MLHERSLRFTSAGLDPWVRCTRAQERELLRHADVLIAAQLRDRETISALVPDRTVRCLMRAVGGDTDPASLPSSSREVLAVGSAHAGNDWIRAFAVDGRPPVAAGTLHERAEDPAALRGDSARRPALGRAARGYAERHRSQARFRDELRAIVAPSVWRRRTRSRTVAGA